MVSFDQVLSLIAVAQTILATLRATSRTLELCLRGTTSREDIMEGPLIMPPKLEMGEYGGGIKNNSNTSAFHDHAFLWDLALAFRQGVKLSIDRDSYEFAYEVDSSQFLRTTSSSALNTISDSLCDNDYDIDDDDRPLVSIQSPRQSAPLETDFYVTLTAFCMIGSQRKIGSDQRPRRARIKCYAPDCFADLRAIFGIGDVELFRKSLLESGPFVSFQSNSKGAARAGGVFFFTRNGAFMIKSIKKDEVSALLNILPRYYRYMERNGHRSLLTRFCGMYEVFFCDDDDAHEGASSYSFIVMNAVFPVEGSRSITERFDLKGSTLGREATAAEKESKGRHAILKDLDLSREVSLLQQSESRGTDQYPSYGIHVGSTTKAAFIHQIRRDVQFLVHCNVIDYSLLIGVAKRNEGNSFVISFAERLIKGFRRVLLLSEDSEKSSRTIVDCGPLSRLRGHRLGSPAVYYVGLIDFLQIYNTKKNMEYHLKSLLYRSSSFSCVPPKQYADRFLAFVDKHML